MKLSMHSMAQTWNISEPEFMNGTLSHAKNKHFLCSTLLHFSYHINCTNSASVTFLIPCIAIINKFECWNKYSNIITPVNQHYNKLELDWNTFRCKQVPSSLFSIGLLPTASVNTLTELLPAFLSGIYILAQ